MRKPLFYYAGRLFGLAMRAVPHRHRVAVAAVLAGPLARSMRRTETFRSLRAMRLNSDRDVSLHLLLTSMTASGTRFSLPLRQHGQRVLHEALASGQGTIIVSAHALLSLLVLRYLHDQGHAPTIVAGDTGMPLAGTDIVAPTVQPSPTLMLGLRGRLRRGGIVCTMVDRMATTGKNTHAFETAVGQMRVSDAAFRLAVGCGARVVFFTARAEGRHVRFEFAAPRAASAGSPDAIAGDFMEFLRAHAAETAATEGAGATWTRPAPPPADRPPLGTPERFHGPLSTVSAPRAGGGSPARDSRASTRATSPRSA